MPRVTHFHISATDPERLIPFYRKIFSWTFERAPGPQEYWSISTGSPKEPGIDGGLHLRRQDNRVVNTIPVEDIDAVLEQVEQNGGGVVQKTSIPGVGKVAMFEDPERNLFQLLQSEGPQR